MEWIRLMGSTFFNEPSIKQKLAGFIKKAKQLSMGETTKEFEKRFAAFQGTGHCVSFNSGSSANLALVQALLNTGKLKKKDRVAFSALTWATNVMPLLQLGLEPVPVDVETGTVNVSSGQFLKTIKKNRVRAFFITNALGFCGDLDRIREICEKRKIILIEDNCESLGSIHKRKKLGNFGLASTFSFFVGHHLSTIEGGAVCTRDEELADALKMVRAHGWDRNLEPRKAERLRARDQIDEFYGRYTFYDLAYNFRPTEIASFIGIEQLKTVDVTIAVRQKNFRTFHAAGNNPDILPLDVSHMELVSNFAYPAVFRTKELQEGYIREFTANRVEVRPVIGGNMCAQPFFKKHVKKIYALPNSDLVHSHGIYFPNHPELKASEIKRLVSLISKRNTHG